MIKVILISEFFNLLTSKITSDEVLLSPYNTNTLLGTDVLRIIENNRLVDDLDYSFYVESAKLYMDLTKCRFVN